MRRGASMAHEKDTDERRFSRMYGEIRVGVLTARRAQRAALPADAWRLDQEPGMKDDTAISQERLLIQPAGIGGVKAPQRLSASKDPFVTPTAPRNLWLYLRAIFGTETKLQKGTGVRPDFTCGGRGVLFRCDD
jgi:hypothetical protein